jgi:hypothetical protein
MSISINGLGFPKPTVPAAPTAGPGSVQAGDAPVFENLLLKSLNQVNGLEATANAAVEKSSRGTTSRKLRR